ncbi:MAG: M48 family metallopeptidase [Candidatus Eremiobacteraeota bacterium]|nr:M48 family metallopeptidase [Candidatus Eremiobacteraeota bacterium]
MQTFARLSAAATLSIALTVGGAVPAQAYTEQEQWELQVGQQEYQQLQGKIVPPSSPLYSKLGPIAKRIKRVADHQYFVPFHFILVNDNSPNAFSVPGGNVYVTTSMMSFAQNKEELAGVLCHEVSHDIHHDVYNLYRKNQNLSLIAGLAGMLVGNSAIGQMVVGTGAQLESLSFSRPVESAADHTGAYICAEAGSNPWGMVWLFKRFQGSQQQAPPMEMLSDHPADNHRITDLENEFRNDPATFGRFNPNPSSGTPL